MSIPQLLKLMYSGKPADSCDGASFFSDWKLWKLVVDELLKPTNPSSSICMLLDAQLDAAEARPRLSTSLKVRLVRRLGLADDRPLSSFKPISNVLSPVVEASSLFTSLKIRLLRRLGLADRSLPSFKSVSNVLSPVAEARPVSTELKVRLLL